MRKTRNFLIVYSKIFASGPNILFIDYAFVNNQIIIFESNLNFMNDPNSGLVTGNSQPIVVLNKKQPKVLHIFAFSVQFFPSANSV
jgi:hypothetical protein